MPNPAVLSLDLPTILWGVFPVQSLPEEFSQANPPRAGNTLCGGWHTVTSAWRSAAA
jgi:hypothetical protein